MVPPLTTARQPALTMGQVAAQAVLDMINGYAPNLPVFEAELVIRESVSRHR